MQRISRRYPKIWINIFFAYLGVTTMASGLLLVKLSRNWMLANWLTNYQGGFVRRGLPGEVYFLLGKALHVTPVFFVMLVCFLLYAIFLLCVRELFLHSSTNVWIAALIVSPATLSFQVLHPRSGYGKETIYLAALALFAVLLRRYQISAIASATYLSIVMLLATFSHEANGFYCFYFLAVLVIGGRTLQQAMRECIIPFSLTAAGIWICSRATGDHAIVEQICSSLGYQVNVPGSTDVCSGGAIPYLFRSREYAHAEVVANMNNYQYLLIFPFFAILAFLPAIGESTLLWRARQRFEITTVWCCVAISVVASLPLFYYAYDWGRWIYFHVASLAVLLVFLDAQRREEVEQAEEAAKVRPEFQYVRLAAHAVFLIAYAGLWILPSSIEPLRMGYAGRLMYLAHFSKKTSTEVREPIRF